MLLIDPVAARLRLLLALALDALLGDPALALASPAASGGG